jgi:hypothetical protein
MRTNKKRLFSSLTASLLSLCGCGQSPPAAQNDNAELILIEETQVSGFDPDGEPVIKRWSDGSIWIHFEAMPPFFSEEDGTESEFDEFELIVQNAIGVTVKREDREVFVIQNPDTDTVEKVTSWLGGFHTMRSGKLGKKED